MPIGQKPAKTRHDAERQQARFPGGRNLLQVSSGADRCGTDSKLLSPAMKRHWRCGGQRPDHFAPYVVVPACRVVADKCFAVAYGFVDIHASRALPRPAQMTGGDIPYMMGPPCGDYLAHRRFGQKPQADHPDCSCGADLGTIGQQSAGVISGLAARCAGLERPGRDELAWAPFPCTVQLRFPLT